jgi:hypothetical protein
MSDIKLPERLKRVEIFISAAALSEVKRRAKADLRSVKNFLSLEFERLYVHASKPEKSVCPIVVTAPYTGPVTFPVLVPSPDPNPVIQPFDVTCGSGNLPAK